MEQERRAREEQQRELAQRAEQARAEQAERAAREAAVVARGEELVGAVERAVAGCELGVAEEALQVLVAFHVDESLVVTDAMRAREGQAVESVQALALARARAYAERLAFVESGETAVECVVDLLRRVEEGTDDAAAGEAREAIDAAVAALEAAAAPCTFPDVVPALSERIDSHVLQVRASSRLAACLYCRCRHLAVSLRAGSRASCLRAIDLSSRVRHGRRRSSWSV